MSSVEERVSKLREERLAREKARIEKLRELNLKKYNPPEPALALPKNFIVKAPSVKSLHKSASLSKVTTNRPSTAPIPPINQNVKNKELTKPKMEINKRNFNTKIAKIKPFVAEAKKTTDGPSTSQAKEKHITNAMGDSGNNNVPIQKKQTKSHIAKFNLATHKTDSKPQTYDTKSNLPIQKTNPRTENANINLAHQKAEPKANAVNNNVAVLKKQAQDKPDIKLSRKSFAAPLSARLGPKPQARKSMLPTSTVNHSKKPNPDWESVFERLYKPKAGQNPSKNDDKGANVQKVLKKPVDVTKRHTVFNTKPKAASIRRSISAVHFKKINKSELQNCFHKWASIGDKLNEVHLNEDEDDASNENKIVSAVKSEHKKVKFHTSSQFNCNTPRPEELQARLQNWLQKRGKSLHSFQHLQCFGINHLAPIRPLKFEDAQDFYDDENKENIAVESDSDDNSYTENMNDRQNDFADDKKGLTDDKNSFAADKWRRASIASSSTGGLNDTSVTLTSESPTHHVDEMLLGALTDLTEVIKEGYDWAQCARWLRAIRERFPSAPSTAAYWECRAALEEGRGNLPLSVHCWEEAIVNGTERSVVEASLDQLLDKFMQLNISPNSKSKEVNPKLVDAKNVFKSTIIKFAVQQAKLRQSAACSPRFTVTPVRRSGRLSVRERSSVKRSPLRVCASVRQAQKFAGKALFVPNPALVRTP